MGGASTSTFKVSDDKTGVFKGTCAIVKFLKAPGIPKTSIYGGSSYKANFKLKGSDWQIVKVPMTQFSYDWSGYTGRCDTKDPAGIFSKGTQHYCCDKSGLLPSKPEVCVDSKFLSKIDSVEIWAEGVK